MTKLVDAAIQAWLMIALLGKHWHQTSRDDRDMYGNLLCFTSYLYF